MEAHQSRPRIVLADDNFTTQQVLRLSFAGEEVEIECCDSGEAALRQLDSAATEVLLANVYLPDMDGYELCRRLRETGNRSTRVIMLVGAFQSFDEKKASSVGCRHSLSKPFDTFSLVNLVKKLIEARPEPQPEEVVELEGQPEEARHQLFDPPFSPVGADLVFDLTVEQCRFRASHLTRELSLTGFPQVALAEVEPLPANPASVTPQLDRERLLEILNERVPEAIRNLLPDIVRELDESP